jgi:predicted CXXCH cytochrome family protein
MQIDRPVLGAVPKTFSGPRVLILLLLGASIFGASAMAAPAKGASTSTTTRSAKAAPGDFVGGETCATCHEEVGKKFANNPHSKLALLHGGAGVTCESCHGAGKAHVDGGGDTTKIFNPAKASAQEVDKTCLTCHSGKHANFDRSPHAKANVSCTSCHSVHNPKTSASNAGTRMMSTGPLAPPQGEHDHLLKDSQPNLCYQCHGDQKAQFSMPFHHKVNEGVTQCSDCHDPHGTFNGSNLKNTADQNAICTKCHTETRGPFVFEHAAVRDGCVGCHTPHGSQNARLLNMPSIATLCTQCHSPVANGTVHGLDAGSNSATPCVSCHTMIHGSNASQAFIR